MKGTFKLGKVALTCLFIGFFIVFIVYINYRTGYNAIQILWSVVLCILSQL
jgi:hypothetical protein